MPDSVTMGIDLNDLFKGIFSPSGAIEISGEPRRLRIGSAVAGSQPKSARDDSTSYSIKSDSYLSEIYLQTDHSFPEGVTLGVTLQAPPKAISMGRINVNQVAQRAVRRINRQQASNLTITYELDATVKAKPQRNPRNGINVIFTIM
ncbi:MAG: hypothetical protein K0U13_04195 [Chlamydiae bacterium]|nr:hypothetical protein [Chlamydiota bacterium]